jgi:arylsulfatase A-like enzyme
LLWGTVKTPRLDRLAGEGMRLENYNTEAQCTPTRAAILTGRMPVRSGTCRVPMPGEGGHYGLCPWEYTLAELFSDLGYRTACFGKWHVGESADRLPNAQGFDEWWGIPNITPPVPGVRMLDTAQSLQPAYNTGVPKPLSGT